MPTYAKCRPNYVDPAIHYDWLSALSGAPAVDVLFSSGSGWQGMRAGAIPGDESAGSLRATLASSLEPFIPCKSQKFMNSQSARKCIPEPYGCKRTWFKFPKHFKT